MQSSVSVAPGLSSGEAQAVQGLFQLGRVHKKNLHQAISFQRTILPHKSAFHINC